MNGHDDLSMLFGPSVCESGTESDDERHELAEQRYIKQQVNINDPVLVYLSMLMKKIIVSKTIFTDAPTHKKELNKYVLTEGGDFQSEICLIRIT